MLGRRDPREVTLYSERLILRLPRHGDEGALVRYYTENRKHLQPVSPTFDSEIFSNRGWRGRIDATVAEYQQGRGLRLVMFDRKAANQVIGIANFTSITSFPAYGCNLGYSLALSAQGQGYMAEGLRVAIDYAVGKLNLHRIEANYMPRNERSGKVLATLGFVIEGHAKNYLLIDGKWEDHVRTSLTNPRWGV